MSATFGLIGYPLSHSFSGRYFAEKFQNEGIQDATYELFEIPTIDEVQPVFRTKGLKGFNVTIPYKQSIKAYLDDFDISAQKVGAVNVVKITSKGRRIGYNSDYYGFEKSLKGWVDLKGSPFKALILGTGGASMAVRAVLTDYKIPFKTISRSEKGDLTYEALKAQKTIIETHRLIINTTPLGMSPHTDQYPTLPYATIGPKHFLYDLIYNPSETVFMTLGKERGAQVKNGYEMLELQAEKSWEIWND